MPKSPTITSAELTEELVRVAERDIFAGIGPPKGLLAHQAGCRQKNKYGYRGLRKNYAPYMRHRPWKAMIEYRGKKYYLGSYVIKEDAARAYDVAARKIWGDAAVTNFPKEQT
jgi:hypothetical protein